MRRTAWITCIALAWLAPGLAHAATLKISCGAVGLEFDLCRQEAEAWGKKTGNEIQVVATPNDSNERLALYQQILGSGSDKIDVFQIDVVWPGVLAEHLADLKPFTNGAEKAHFEGLIANNTVGGRLLAMPWFTDAGLLFYRKDLLEKYRLGVPLTWDDLAFTAKKVQEAERAGGNDKMWGYVWQGRAYEGLTCNALEWIVSNGGGTIVDDKGTVTVNNPAAIKAIDMAATWVGTITPRAVLNYGEEEGRGVFQAGNAVFLRSWPYVWALSQKEDSMVKGKVGVVALPRSPTHRNVAVLGGWQLAVSKYSRNQKLASDLVMYLTSSDVQKDRALKGAFNPTITALYRDADVLKVNPFMGDLFGMYATAARRPSSITAVKYNEVSSQFWSATHDVLAGKTKAADALASLERSLKALSAAGTWK